MVKFIGVEKRMVAARGQEEGEWGAVVYWGQSFRLKR